MKINIDLMTIIDSYKEYLQNKLGRQLQDPEYFCGEEPVNKFKVYETINNVTFKG